MIKVKMETKLENKVVLITGASSGIGKATALAFAKLGSRLSLVARRRERVEAVAADCRANGSPSVLVCECDLSIEEQCVKAVQNTVEMFNGIDVLVNNAGRACKTSTAADSTSQDLTCLMNINVRAVMILTQQCIPHLIKSKGTIVNVSSIMGTHAVPGVLPYNVSKAALDMLTRISAQELAPKGVRVNSVNPGIIHTELSHSLGMTDAEFDEFTERQARMHSLGRIGTVEEVANAIIFLASSLSSFTTGQRLYVDGGFHDTTSCKSFS